MAIEFKPSAPHAKKSKKSPLHRLSFFDKGVSAKERMFFTERLALLLETGNSIHPSLLALQQQTDHPTLVAIIGDLTEQVASGKTFSSALALHPEMFPPTYVSLVACSELGGFTADVLKQLQIMEEKRDRLRATLISAFSYPAFLGIFSISVVLFILLVVFPKFGPLFVSIRDQLPFTTLLLMETSEWARTFWYLILFVPMPVLYFLKQWLTSSTGRALTDRFKLHFPLVKHLFIQIYLVHFFRVMSLSLANGVSVMDALTSSLEVINNVVFRRFVKRLLQYVSEGQGISQGFTEADFIPDMARHTIQTGEQTGHLALVMDKMADFYDREIERKLIMLSKIAEPLMLLIMGAVVGVIVASLILPIFKLGRVVN